MGDPIAEALRRLRALVEFGLGATCLAFGDLDEADEYLWEAYEQFVQLGSRDMIATTQAHLGEVWAQQGKLRDAEWALWAAADHQRRDPRQRVSLGETLARLAGVYELLERPQQAADLLAEACVLLIGAMQFDEALKCLRRLAGVLVGMGGDPAERRANLAATRQYMAGLAEHDGAFPRVAELFDAYRATAGAGLGARLSDCPSER